MKTFTKMNSPVLSTLLAIGMTAILAASPLLSTNALADPPAPGKGKGDEMIIIIDGKEPSKLQIFTPDMPELMKKKPKTAPQQIVPTPTAPVTSPGGKPGTAPSNTTTAPAPAGQPASSPAQPASAPAATDGEDNVDTIPLNDPEKLKQWLEKHGVVVPGGGEKEELPTPEQLEDAYHQVWRLVAMKYYKEQKLVDANWETWYDKYKGKLVTGRDLENALTEMMAAVGDRWTQHTSSDEIERYRARAKNDIVGLGLSVAQKADGTYFIDFLSYGTSVWKSNAFRTGDTLKSIQISPETPDSKVVSVTGMSKKDVEELLQQKVGTKVSVVIAHDGIEEKIDLAFEKEGPAPIMLKPLPNNIGYVRLPSFGSDQRSVSALGNAFVEGLGKLDEYYKGNMQGLVLDLRGNSGGAVELAKMIASLFIEQGSFIRQEERTGRVTNNSVETFNRPTKFQMVGVPPQVISLMRRLQTMPMVVLVNGSSASSSEILTGVLMDNHRATVVGTQTFGKAVAFVVQPTPMGGYLQVTTMHYLTPSGKDIAGVGITPDIVLDNKRGSAATDDELALASKLVSDAITKLNVTNQVNVPAQNGAGFGGDSVLYIGIGLGLMLLIAVLAGAWHHFRSKRDEAERKQK